MSIWKETFKNNHSWHQRKFPPTLLNNRYSISWPFFIHNIFYFSLICQKMFKANGKQFLKFCVCVCVCKCVCVSFHCRVYVTDWLLFPEAYWLQTPSFGWLLAEQIFSLEMMIGMIGWQNMMRCIDGSGMCNQGCMGNDWCMGNNWGMMNNSWSHIRVWNKGCMMIADTQMDTAFRFHRFIVDRCCLAQSKHH